MLYLLLLSLPGKLSVIITGLGFYKHLPKAYRLILLHAFIVMLCEIAGYYFSASSNKNNSWLFNCFWILPELILMGGAGIMLVRKGVLKKFFTYLLAIGIVIWGINIYTAGINTLANFAFMYISLLLIVIYLNILLSNLFNESQMLKQPAFWLCLSVLLYFSCALPYFGLHILLTDKYRHLAYNLFYINTTLNFIRYPMVAFGFYLAAKQAKQV